MGSLLFVFIVLIVSHLVIVGYLHRDNNYGVRAGDYNIRTIGATEFAELAPDLQSHWVAVPDSDAYVHIIIKNSFVFLHVRNALMPALAMAIAALFLYRWSYKSRLPETEPSLSTIAGLASHPSTGF